MPYEKDVKEEKSWWCPKWYWPFAVCSGLRTQHKWCYNFSWVTYAEYGLVKHWEGCENGKLYTWSEATFGITKTTYVIPQAEMCFNSSRGADEGVCDPSNTGMMASQLARAAPSASPIRIETTSLSSTVVESGTFYFEGEYETKCRNGAWPWTLSAHEEMIFAFVDFHNMEIQWQLAGIPLNDTIGVLKVAVLCSWPMPLPNGKSQNRVVNVRYVVEQDGLRSTLKLFNDPQDGTYMLSIGMIATSSSGKAITSFTSSAFHGQICDFDPQQTDDLIKCLTSKIVIPHQPVEFSRRVHDDYGVFLGDQFWRSVPGRKRPIIESIFSVMKASFITSPALFAEAMTLLEQQTGIVAVSRVMSIKADITTGTNCQACEKVSLIGKSIILRLHAFGTHLFKRLFGK